MAVAQLIVVPYLIVHSFYFSVEARDITEIHKNRINPPRKLSSSTQSLVVFTARLCLTNQCFDFTYPFFLNIAQLYSRSWSQLWIPKLMGFLIYFSPQIWNVFNIFYERIHKLLFNSKQLALVFQWSKPSVTKKDDSQGLWINIEWKKNGVEDEHEHETIDWHQVQHGHKIA